jgi:hypothetical protein
MGRVPAHRIRLLAAALALTMSLGACQLSTSPSPAAPESVAPTAGSTTPATASASPGATSAAAGGNACPMVWDASTASFYPIQPSFSAGYTAAAMKLNDTTASWAYVVSGDFPYAYWMSWYMYSTKGVPLYKIGDAEITPDQGSTNPYVTGNPILAPTRHYHIYFMPSTTPASVVQQMQAEGKNVALMPAVGSDAGVTIVSRVYWPLSYDGLGDYDRFGYRGPTNTPPHTLTAYLTDPTTGALTDTPVSDCGSQSQLPQVAWYDPETNSPIISFEDASPPADDQLTDLPHFLLQTGSVAGALGAEFPPEPVPDEVQFYRNVAANSPYADVASAPAQGDPPDACGGYVFANLPNDVVSLIRVPQIPTFPDYQGATASTLNNSADFDLKFYSIVIYGAQKQADALGSVENSQIGNRQVLVDADGGATVVLYPRSATSDQVAAIDAVAKANGWNILKSGIQTDKAPNLLVVREKGPSDTWANSLSPNSATAGAPCPQTTDPSLPLAQDPPSAQVTQSNGMGLAAPLGANCSVDDFMSGACLATLGQKITQGGGVWSSTSSTPPAQQAP